MTTSWAGTPTAVAGNPNCASLDGSWKEVKVDVGAPNGSVSDGTLTFTILNSDGKVFDWTSNTGVDAVIVKGGNNGANVYRYNSEAPPTAACAAPTTPPAARRR